MERSSIDDSSLKIHYSFGSGSGEILWNDLYAVEEHFSGSCLLANKYPGLSVGYSESPVSGANGVSVFSYTDLLRVGYQLSGASWTVFLDFEALNHCDNNSAELAVLLANKDAVTDNGFLLGLNKSNRLVFENWYSSAKTNQILFDEIADGAVVSLAKNENNFELTYHNYPQSTHNLISFEVGNSSAQNNWYLGGIFTPSYGYNGLSGYFNEFLYFDEALNQVSKNSFSKAFFVTGFVDAYIVNGSGYSTPVIQAIYNTGGIVGVGVTDYETAALLVPQKVGSDIALCQTNEITGYLIGDTIDFVTGDAILVATETLIPAQDSYDYAKLLAYSKSNIVYDGGIDSDDVFEIYAYREPVADINLDLDFDPLFQVFRNENIGSNIYLNGAYQESGIDYSASDLFVSAPGFNGADGSLYDIISGAKSRFEYYNSGSGTLHIGGVDAEKDVYLNGQKLISGMNYTGAGTDLFLLNIENLATGILQFAPRRDDIYQIKTGNVDLSDYKFAMAQVWLNGQRLKETESFVQTNSCSIRLTNDVYRFTNVIYDNNDDFWDI